VLFLAKLYLGGPCANHFKLEMWANAQRDGRPAEIGGALCYNAAKFG